MSDEDEEAPAHHRRFDFSAMVPPGWAWCEPRVGSHFMRLYQLQAEGGWPKTQDTVSILQALDEAWALYRSPPERPVEAAPVASTAASTLPELPPTRRRGPKPKPAPPVEQPAAPEPAPPAPPGQASLFDL